MPARFAPNGPLWRASRYIGNVTTLLDQALAELAKLTPDGQDAIAAVLLSELRDTALWERRFAETQNVLERLADAGVADLARGDVVPFDPERV